MRGPYREILRRGFEVRPSLRGSFVKNEGLVFHGTAPTIRLINSLLLAKRNILRTLTDNLPTHLQKNIFTKLVQNHFPKVFC